MKHVTFAILVASFATPAFAGLPFSKTRPLKVAPTSCANFTGSWVGQCVEGDETTSEELEIKQYGCSLLDFNGFDLILDARTETSKKVTPKDGSGYTQFEDMTLSWDTSRSVVGGSLYFQYEDAYNGNEEFRANVSIGMAGSQLVINVTGDVASKCVYQKKQ